MADQPGHPPSARAVSLLVGREHEQAALRNALSAALAGRGSLVLIGGEAGIGKTALAESICAEAAAQGALVLVGRCYDLTETPPYGPWRELFELAPRADGLPALPAAVLPLNREGESLASREAIVARVRDYLTALAATQPLVLLLEDLHWADPASLDLLRSVARRLADTPALLLGTYRADEIGQEHALFALLPLLVREARAARLDLGPLDMAALGALVATRYDLGAPDHDRLVGYLAGRTEGNALFLGELLRTLEGEGLLYPAGDRWQIGDLATAPVPTLLRQVIAGRLARLAPETQRLLAVAAVIGQEVPLSTWATVAALGEDDLLAHGERAIAARLLVETPDGTGYRFAHALIRETLYAGTAAPRRRAWHRRAGEALAAASPPDPDAVAHHFGRAGDPRAFDWLIRAGLRARHATARLTAAERFAAAAALPDPDGTRARTRGWLLFCRGVMLEFSDNAASVRAHDEAEPLALATSDRALTAYARFVRGQMWCLGGAIRRGMAEMERQVIALEALPSAYHLRSGEEVALATLAAWLAGDAPVPPMATLARTVPPVTSHRAALINWLGHTGRYREALVVGEAFLAALADSDATPTLAAPAYMGIGHAHAGLGNPEEARRAYALSRARHTVANNARMIEFTLWCELLLAVYPYQADDVAERTRLATEAAAAWERARGAIIAGPHDDPTDLLPALVEGRWAAAHQLARDGLAAATTGHAHGAIVALAVLARYQGDPEAAWARVRELLPAGPETEPGDCYFQYGIALQALAADLALDAGDPALAARWIAAHGRWLDWNGAVLWRADHLILRARHARATGDLAASRAEAAVALAQATVPRQPLRLLAARQLLGELDTAVARYGEAAAHLDAALSLAEACAAPYERALTLLAIAELRAATGDRDGAAVALAQAHAILDPLGARPALARAAGLAARLATAPPIAPAAPPFGLTAREAEVLALLAEGLTDQQIGARLFVSRNTVAFHTKAIYGKLGITTRAAAARLALEHRLA